jgi:hypothetical protein
MTTVSRPNVRIDVPDVGDAEKTDTSREELTNKGTKRKRAPKHFGPCEHGVKQRSNCKVCSACPHGRQRCRCKECGGASICEHGRQRKSCKQCGGSQICEHSRVRSYCKECGGGGICEHGHDRYTCKECGGSGICEHSRIRSQCKECGGGGTCEHGRRRTKCKECGGGSICEHGRERSHCKECRARGAAEALLDDICGFLEDRPGRAAPTGLIVDAFSHRVKDKGMFRKLLKQAARLEKGAGTAQWVLREEFA